MKKKKPFALVSMKTKVKTEKDEGYLEVTVSNEVEMIEETKPKKSYKKDTSSDLPHDDYDFILGKASMNGEIARGMTGKEYVDYMLHRDKLGWKKEKERLLF